MCNVTVWNKLNIYLLALIFVAKFEMVWQAKPTGSLLAQLRSMMGEAGVGVQAYIIPSRDAHNSEYTAACDMRRSFISGFTGSAGTAIVTEKQALMWTDGRYFLQAAAEMDENWTLMKEQLPETPTTGAWLAKNLPRGSRIGVDPQLIGHTSWNSLSGEMETAGHALVAVEANLVDRLWSDRPARPQNPVFGLPIEFSGETIDEKLAEVRLSMQEKDTRLLVVSALDEVAWLLNLRGSDIAFNPVFFAYAAVTPDRLHFFVNESRLAEGVVSQHLPPEGVALHAYDAVVPFLRDWLDREEGCVWLDKNANQALAGLVPRRRLFTDITPPCVLKAVKNDVEANGMAACQIRDSAALCSYFAWLEAELAGGTQPPPTEITGADRLERFRSQEKHYKGLSFPTISSVGDHGAIIHYTPSKETDRPITTKELYLCDSGAQYLDGTTDVTRTLHFGMPTQFERECFTRVLKGHIYLATAIFPAKLKGAMLDSFARRALWDVGLDYRHGTGHGIGSFLNVHEGPMGISYKPNHDDPGLLANMFLSDEPGYYADGQFGIRIENILRIVHSTVPSGATDFLAFEIVTLVPIQRKLIVTEMLTEAEIQFVDDYHRECLEKVGGHLLQTGNKEAYDWLVRETKPLAQR